MHGHASHGAPGTYLYKVTCPGFTEQLIRAESEAEAKLYFKSATKALTHQTPPLAKVKAEVLYI